MEPFIKILIYTPAIFGLFIIAVGLTGIVYFLVSGLCLAIFKPAVKDPNPDKAFWAEYLPYGISFIAFIFIFKALLLCIF